MHAPGKEEERGEFWRERGVCFGGKAGGVWRERGVCFGGKEGCVLAGKRGVFWREKGGGVWLK